MKEKILAELQRIEKLHGVNILFAVESGSRAWGFDSPDSDYDVRFVYYRPISWYLSINERRDVIEVRGDPLDIDGWDLKKALHQIYKGNPAFFEWLKVPDVYIDHGRRSELLSLATKYFNPRSAIYHYLHMAEGNYRTYLKVDQVQTKKYLYVVRPLLACMWIEKTQMVPPTGLENMMQHIDKTGFPEAEFGEILSRKKGGGEFGMGPRIDVVNKWIEEKIIHFAEAARTAPKVSAAPDDLNEYLMNTVFSAFCEG